MGLTEERILLVCTANVCRSPMAEILLRSYVPSACGARIASAGFMSAGNPADEMAVKVLRRYGLELSAHTSRRVETALTAEPELILVMSRQHLRCLLDINSSFLKRSFTLKEFVHLAELEGERLAGEALASYVARLGASRSLHSAFSPLKDMDIEDPVGKRMAVFVRCADEISTLARRGAAMLYPVAQRPAGG